MAAAGEGPSSGYGGNGAGAGAGGKFRKRPFRKAAHTTPYDRPENPSWLSKIVVEPASRLIASSAQRFFASVFRKRLPPPPPPPPPEMPQVLGYERPEAAENAEAQEPAVLDLPHNPVNDSKSKVERMLKENTFTRSEIHRLTELLQSRAENGPLKSDFRTEANRDQLVTNSPRQQQYLSSSLSGKSTPYDLPHGLNVTPSTRVLEEDIASPAEIARAYMGNPTSRISPSKLGPRTANLLGNVPYTPKSSVTPMATKGSGNGFVTPRSRGRSAIYTMARHPAFGKASGSRLSGFGGPLPALSLNEQPGELGSNKMAQKRRRSVLDDDLGSMGPMRRTRQKPNMLSHNTFLHQGTGSSSLARQRPLMDESAQRSSKVTGEIDDLRTSGTCYDHVHPNSVRNGRKIIDYIDYMLSKPKSPAKLTTDMLRGQALKSLEDSDSSKLLYNNHVHNELDSGSPSEQNNTKEKKDRTEEIVLQKFNSQNVSIPAANGGAETSQNDVSIPAANGGTETSQKDVSIPAANGYTETSVKGTSTSVEDSYFVAKAEAQHLPKKHGFTMNFHEDWDDDSSCDGPTLEVLPTVSSKQEKQNLAAVEKSFPHKLPVLPDDRTPPESVYGKRLDLTTPPSSLKFDSTKQASNNFLGSDPVANHAGSEPMSYTLPNPDRILPGSVKSTENSVVEAAKINGKMDNSPSGPSSSTPFGGISSSFPITDKGVSAAILAPASTGITNSILTNGTSNIASSASAISSGATTSFSPAFAFATSLSTEAAAAAAPAPAPKTTVNIASAGNPFISASNAEVHAPKSGKESSAENTSSLLSSDTSFATSSSTEAAVAPKTTVDTECASNPSVSASNAPFSSNTSFATAGTSVFGLSNPFTASHTSGAGSGAGSVSAMAQAQFASSSAVASVPLFSSPSLSETKQFGPSSGTTTGMFSFSAKAPSSEANVTSSNSNYTPFGTTASVTNATGSSISTPSFGFGTTAIGSSTPLSTSAGNFGGNSFSSTGLSFGTNSAPVLGSSSGTTSALAFGSSGSFQSNTSAPAFGSSGSFQSNASAPAFGSSGSFQSNASAPVFGSSGSFQSTTSAPPFSSPFPSTISAPVLGSSSGFSSASGASSLFGPSSGSFSSISKTPGFGSSTSSSQSVFGVQPGFGVSAPSFTAPAVNNDQMQEETMAEVTVNSSMPVAPMFSQQPIPSPSPGGFSFTAQPTNPFSFAGQQSQAAPQSPFVFSGQQNQAAAQQSANPFQASSSLEGVGGGFSMGSGAAGDMSGRKFIRVRRAASGKKK